MQNNLHLVPQPIVDLVAKINTKPISQNEYYAYQMRLEAIIEYCQKGLTQAEKNSIFSSPSKKR